MISRMSVGNITILTTNSLIYSKKLLVENLRNEITSFTSTIKFMLLVGRSSAGILPYDVPFWLSLQSLVGLFSFVNCEHTFVFTCFISRFTLLFDVHFLLNH